MVKEQRGVCESVMLCEVEAFSSEQREGGPPVSIPNTVVKPFSADGTARVAAWERRSSLERFSAKTPGGISLPRRLFLF